MKELYIPVNIYDLLDFMRENMDDIRSRRIQISERVCRHIELLAHEQGVGNLNPKTRGERNVNIRRMVDNEEKLVCRSRINCGWGEWIFCTTTVLKDGSGLRYLDVELMVEGKTIPFLEELDSNLEDVMFKFERERVVEEPNENDLEQSL